ncbi:MAG: hypothetical protein N2691_04030 [Patescibacteria group bacterium]|nr:hypothetical protein [Patescibacteria group bacterium]
MVKCKKMLPTIIISATASTPGPEVARIAMENKVPAHHIFTVTVQDGKRELTIEQLREVQLMASRSVAVSRLFVLCDFDTAAEQTQNTLLKSLEEANEKDYFILYARSLYRIIPTIRSRCSVVNQFGSGNLSVGAEIQEFTRRLFTEPYFYLSAPCSSALTAERAPAFLDEVVLSLRDYILQPGVSGAIRELLRTKSLIENNNAHPQLSVDSALIAAQNILRASR